MVLSVYRKTAGKASTHFVRKTYGKREKLRRLIDGICYEPLAEEFDLSVRQMKNIVYRYSESVFL